MRGFDHATIPPFVYKIRRTTSKGTSRKIGGGMRTLPETLTPVETKIFYFPYPISDLKPWSPARDRSAWQAITARTRLA